MTNITALRAKMSCHTRVALIQPFHGCVVQRVHGVAGKRQQDAQHFLVCDMVHFSCFPFRIPVIHRFEATPDLPKLVTNPSWPRRADGDIASTSKLVY